MGEGEGAEVGDQTVASVCVPIKLIGSALLTIAFMFFNLSQTLAASHSLPNWIIVKPGAVGYLDDDGAGGKSDPPGRRTVCDSLTAYLHRDDDDASERGCIRRRAFGLVRVVRIVKHFDLLYRKGKTVVTAPLVAITSLSAGWSGVVIGLALLPIAPIGTKLELHRGDLCSRSASVELVRGDIAYELKPAHGFLARERTMVEVIDRHVPDTLHYPIEVKILTGKHRNEKVWTMLYTLPHGAFWMQDPENIVP